MLYIEQEFKQPFLEHLEPNERVVWAGQPKQGFFFSKMDVFLIPFSIVWCGIVAFWMISASEASIFFALLGVPFMLIGFFLLIGRFFLDSRKRKQTYYALTNERALIKVLGKQPVFKEIELNSELKTHLEEDPKSPDDVGTILFVNKNLFERKEAPKSYATSAPSSTRFLLISNASKVYRELNEIISSEREES